MGASSNDSIRGSLFRGFSSRTERLRVLRGLAALLIFSMVMALAACSKEPPAQELEEIRSSVKRLEGRLTLIERNNRKKLAEIDKRLDDINGLLSGVESREKSLEATLKKLGEQVYSMQKAMAEEKAAAAASVARGGSPQGAAAEKKAGVKAGAHYVVKPGDTLYRIARKHNMTVEELLRLNNLSEGQYIYPGQKLLTRGR
ncbi:MAG: LysM peptidoglycan-binding domain-containing protein [Deltaproteobacteria bacterium]|nr:LysM peptidoglycan-binding domain-containing protein [Deltaproteobacteria bacterium]